MTLGVVQVDCPHCRRPLPPIEIDATTEESPDGLTDDVAVCLTPVFGALFYKRLRLAHPWCFGGKDELPTELAA